MIRKLKSGQYRLYSRKIDPKTGSGTRVRGRKFTHRGVNGGRHAEQIYFVRQVASAPSPSSCISDEATEERLIFTPGRAGLQCHFDNGCNLARRLRSSSSPDARRSPSRKQPSSSP